MDNAPFTFEHVLAAAWQAESELPASLPLECRPRRLRAGLDCFWRTGRLGYDLVLSASDASWGPDTDLQQDVNVVVAYRLYDHASAIERWLDGLQDPQVDYYRRNEDSEWQALVVHYLTYEQAAKLVVYAIGLLAAPTLALVEPESVT